MPSTTTRLLRSLSTLSVPKLFHSSRPSSNTCYPAPFGMLEPGRKKPLGIDVFFANLRLWSMTNPTTFRDPFVASLTRMKIISKGDLLNHEFLLAEVYPNTSYVRDGRPPIPVVLEQNNGWGDDRIGIDISSLHTQTKYRFALPLDYINFPAPGVESMSSPLPFYQLVLALQRTYSDTKPYAFEQHDCSFISNAAMKIVAALTQSSVTTLESPIYRCRSKIVTSTSRCCLSESTASLSDDFLHDIAGRTLQDVRSFETYIDNYQREIRRMLASSKFRSQKREKLGVKFEVNEHLTVPTGARGVTAGPHPGVSEGSPVLEIGTVRRKEEDEGLVTTRMIATMTSTTLNAGSCPVREEVVLQVSGDLKTKMISVA